MSVTNKSRMHFFVGRIFFFDPRHFKIEHAHSETLFPIVGPPVTRAHHHALARFFFSPEINHGVRDRRIALNRVSAGPEEKIARFQAIELESLLLPAHDRLDFAGVPQPDVLAGGIARDIVDPVLS